MRAKENKTLAIAAISVILLSQPALARGGGFGGDAHGFGGIGVHGFSGGFSPATHGERSSGFGGRASHADNGDQTLSDDRALKRQSNH